MVSPTLELIGTDFRFKSFNRFGREVHAAFTHRFITRVKHGVTQPILIIALLKILASVGTASGNWAIHNYEDRSFAEVIPHDELFLGHFDFAPRIKRKEEVPSADDVLGHFHERLIGLDEEQAQKEAERCMSCGMCFECDNCVIFCPQDAVYRVKKNESTTGRYVATDYSRCIGCHICADVCPTGYIKMGMGE